MFLEYRPQGICSIEHNRRCRGHAVWASVSATCPLLLTVLNFLVACAVWSARRTPLLYIVRLWLIWCFYYIVIINNCFLNFRELGKALYSLISVFAVRMKKAWVLSYPLSVQQRLWSDWADAQADLSLRRAHSHFVGFVMSRLISVHLSQII